MKNICQTIELPYDVAEHKTLVQNTYQILLENSNILSVKDLDIIVSFIRNPNEYGLVDYYYQTPIDNNLYDKLKNKYPEEFV